MVNLREEEEKAKTKLNFQNNVHNVIAIILSLALIALTIFYIMNPRCTDREIFIKLFNSDYVCN